jgi:hypothetical protein
MLDVEHAQNFNKYVHSRGSEGAGRCSIWIHPVISNDDRQVRLIIKQHVWRRSPDITYSKWLVCESKLTQFLMHSLLRVAWNFYHYLWKVGLMGIMCCDECTIVPYLSWSLQSLVSQKDAACFKAQFWNAEASTSLKPNDHPLKVGAFVKTRQKYV